MAQIKDYVGAACSLCGIEYKEDEDRSKAQTLDHDQFVEVFGKFKVCNNCAAKIIDFIRTNIINVSQK